MDRYTRSSVLGAFQDIVVAPDKILDQSTLPDFNYLIETFSPVTLLALFNWLDSDDRYKGTPSGMMINARLEDAAGTGKKH